MDVRDSRQNPPPCARPEGTFPEERLPLPHGYSIYASAAQTGSCDSGRRAARGPPRRGRRPLSAARRRCLVLVGDASWEYTSARRETDCFTQRHKAKPESHEEDTFFMA